MYDESHFFFTTMNIFVATLADSATNMQLPGSKLFGSSCHNCTHTFNTTTSWHSNVKSVLNRIVAVVIKSEPRYYWRQQTCFRPCADKHFADDVLINIGIINQKNSATRGVTNYLLLVYLCTQY